MVLLSANNLSKSFGSHLLFEGVSLIVGENDRLGLVGVNGVGKSTLFKILAGREEHDGGTVERSKLTQIGYMEQNGSYSSEGTVLGEVMKVFAPLIEMEKELSSLHTRIEKEGADPALIERQFALNERYQSEGGLTYRSRARATLIGLGFLEGELDLTMGALSGGQRTRVELATILLSGANLLLLDEPTNHLDIAAVGWLEEFLRSFSGAYIIISHDRYFLDRVTSSTLELSNTRLKRFLGPYSVYAEKKEQEQSIKEHHYKSQTREIKRLEGIVAQQRRWNREKNIRTAESKQKQIERLKKDLERPDADPEAIKFAFEAKSSGATEVLTIEGLSKSFGQKPLFSDIDIHIQNGEKVFLLGPNGCGKSTLLNIVMRKLPPDSGRVRLGENIVAAYYEQTQRGLSTDKSVLDEISDSFPRMTNTEVRCALAAFLFKGDTVFRELSVLSGGERARVALLKLMMSGANLLILDEPTNHLDINSAEALEEALLSYNGTVLCVSHDRYFINRMADRIYYMGEEGCAEYLGNYDYFLEKQKEGGVKSQGAKKPPSLNAADYQERKQKESQIRRTQGRIERLEEEIDRAEGRLLEIDESLSRPDVSCDYRKSMELTDTRCKEHQILDGLFLEWEELNCELLDLTQE